MKIRTFLAALCLSAGSSAAAAAPCITKEGEFPGYVRAFAADAKSHAVGQLGLQALSAAELSAITWRFEANPRSQTGTLQSDPAKFLANRSGATADVFIGSTRNVLRRYAKAFTALENRYGVPGSVLATIWGLETRWGGYLGSTPIVSGAVTLASHCRRHPRFESHALAALKLVDQGLISTATKGGPSGELGHMQFLAGNWLRYRVDANGDGRADPYDAMDALATAANMLKSNGWRPNEPFHDGSHNFQVLSVWNDSANYQRAIAFAAGRARD